MGRLAQRPFFKILIMKICSKCEIQKPLNLFSKNKSKKEGLNSVCKECHKTYIKKHYQKNKEYYVENAEIWKTKNPNRRKEIALQYARKNPDKIRNNFLKSQYGITLDQFNVKLVSQKYKCVICDNKFENSRDTHMDHCHKTGKVRDILCGSCNKGLGHFKDSIKTLLAAAKYLTKHQN